LIRVLFFYLVQEARCRLERKFGEELEHWVVFGRKPEEKFDAFSKPDEWIHRATGSAFRSQENLACSVKTLAGVGRGCKMVNVLPGSASGSFERQA
jgi:hypothetical protein